jgi:hypothetical protein
VTSTVFLCYAAQDRDTAAVLAAFLEAGADLTVFLDEGVLREGESLAEKAREARTADTVIVLFSRHSLPPRWPRAEWEDALVSEPAEEGVRMAFARCDECVPPRVLKPQFDLAGASRNVLREVKRWVLGKEPPAAGPFSHPELERLAVAIADCPGNAVTHHAHLAGEFLEAFGVDFDEVITLDCTGRSITAVAGELGVRLGLRLDGDLESNLDRLWDFCSAHRFLIVLCGAGEDEIAPFRFGGLCSTLVAPSHALPESSDPLRRVQHVLAHPGEAADWQELCALARLGRRLTEQHGRLAECDELMQQWHAAAQECGDRAVLDESARQMVWILETWGRLEDARLLEYRRITEFGDQMPLPF